jgi:tRNA (mo5U34)-methyltransferase
MEQSVLAAIRQHKWYHTFEVLPGVWSAGVHPTDAAALFETRFSLPQDLRGKRALDIGALDGPYSFELERRGAEVTSLDIQRWDVTGYSIAHRARKSRARYVQGSVYHLERLLPGEKFDIITYFGVWYHLKHPIVAVEQIQSVLKDDGVCFAEGECLLNYIEDPKSHSMVEPIEFARRLARSPAPYSLYYAGPYKGDRWSWYVPNPACVEQWFQTAGMRIEHSGTWDQHPHQRMYCTARKIPGAAIDVDNPVW